MKKPPPASKTKSPAKKTPRRATHFIELESINPFVRIAREVVKEAGFQTGRRRIPDCEFVLILEGEGCTDWEGRKHPFKAGDLLYYRPYRWHNFVTAGAVPVQHIAVHFDYSPRLRYADWKKSTPPPDVVIGGAVPFPMQMELPPRSPLLGLFKRITECDVRSSRGRFHAKGILIEILYELVNGLLDVRRTALHEHSATDTVNRERVRQALEFIEKHYAEPLTLPQLAGQAGLSATHFLRVFKGIMGQAPIDYLIRIRIRAAKQLLADVRLTISEVAYKVGYNDPHYFARQFRANDGLSPTEYRASILNSEQ